MTINVAAALRMCVICFGNVSLFCMWHVNIRTSQYVSEFSLSLAVNEFSFLIPTIPCSLPRHPPPSHVTILITIPIINGRRLVIIILHIVIVVIVRTVFGAFVSSQISIAAEFLSANVAERWLIVHIFVQQLLFVFFDIIVYVIVAHEINVRPLHWRIAHIRMRFHVNLERTTATKAAITYFTIERITLRMQDHVNRQAFGQAKTFATHIASEWFVTLVDAFVHVEIAENTETFVANVAFVFFACMIFTMKSELGIVFETFAAQIASEVGRSDNFRRFQFNEIVVVRIKRFFFHGRDNGLLCFDFSLMLAAGENSHCWRFMHVHMTFAFFLGSERFATDITFEQRLLYRCHRGQRCNRYRLRLFDRHIFSDRMRWFVVL